VFEFSVNNQMRRPTPPPIPDPIQEAPPAENTFSTTPKMTAAERMRMATDKLRTLQNVTLNSSARSLEGKKLETMENIPAFMRRNVPLDNVKPSNAEPDLSRMSLGHDNDGRPTISPKNGYLHDQAD
jgi:hypothetical protein